jgi:hypothetical protein
MEEIDRRTLQAQRDRVRESIKTFQEEDAHLSAQLGEESAASVRTTRMKEDEDSELFDRLSPAERKTLWETNRGEWQRILDAKEKAGLRKLFA